MRRTVTGLMASLSLFAQSGEAAQRKPVSASAAPASWIAYAAQVNALVRARLERGDVAALQLRRDLAPAVAATAGPDTAAQIAVIARIWVDRAGRIVRADLDSTGGEAAQRRFSAIFVGASIGTRPPRGMLLPLRIQLDLRAAPRDDPADSKP